MASRCSPLNAALVANEKNAAKTECLGLMSTCFGFDFAFKILALGGCDNRASVIFAVWVYCFINRFTC